MTVQLLALLAFALIVLFAREQHLYQEHKQHAHDRLDARLAEDTEVALLEDWFDLDWTDAR